MEKDEIDILREKIFIFFSPGDRPIKKDTRNSGARP